MVKIWSYSCRVFLYAVTKNNLKDDSNAAAEPSSEHHKEAKPSSSVKKKGCTRGRKRKASPQLKSPLSIAKDITVTHVNTDANYHQLLSMAGLEVHNTFIYIRSIYNLYVRPLNLLQDMLINISLKLKY